MVKPAKDNSNVWVITHDGTWAWHWVSKRKVEFGSEAEANQFSAREGIHVVDDRKQSCLEQPFWD